MRNPERINRILNLIDDIWIKNPDLRLFQLLIAGGLVNLPHRYTTGGLFNYEDDTLEKNLVEFRNKINK